MKIIGTIVDDKMNLIGCVLKGTPSELNICSDERKTVVEFSLRDTKKVMSNGNCSNFKLSRAGDFVPKGFQKLSDLPMYDTTGKEISNEIELKAIVERDGVLLGAVVFCPAMVLSKRLKLYDLFYLYSYCKASNFVLKEKDSVPFITGKNGHRKEEFPVLSEFLNPFSKQIVIPTDMEVVLSDAFKDCESLKKEKI